MITIIICIAGLILGHIVSKNIGDSREATFLKVLLIIGLVLFSIWNEGGFN